MAIKSQPPARPVNIGLKVARLEASKASASSSLPGDMLQDLTEAFAFYDNDEAGIVSIEHFNNILHNFGFHKSTKKDKDVEIQKAANPEDFSTCTGVDFPFIRYLVARKWNQGQGNLDEASDCFKLFNKRNHDSITAAEVKSTLMEYLEFNVTDNDINEFMDQADNSGSGHIDFKAFSSLYNS